MQPEEYQRVYESMTKEMRGHAFNILGRAEPLDDLMQEAWLRAYMKVDKLQPEFAGKSVPTGYPIYLPLSCFGGESHIKMDGSAGSGKSILLNYIAVQLPVPFAMYDEMDKWSGSLAAILPHARLRIIDLATYQRNILMGPRDFDQIQWLTKAGDYLMEVLDLEPIAMRHVVRICKQIVADGQIANLPRLISRLDEKDMSQRAILNRLIPLCMSYENVFDCDHGFDLNELFDRSFIFNIRDADESMRKLLMYDHFLWLVMSSEKEIKWRLRRAFLYHEAGSLFPRSGAGKFIMRMVRECRNYGIGLVLCDQLSNLTHEELQANIGTRILFRIKNQGSLAALKTDLALSEEQKTDIMNLPNRHIAIKFPNLLAFKAKVPSLL